MSELAFIGLGLSNERSISLQGLDLARESDCVFAEFYTSLMPQLDLKELEELVGKPIELLKRTDVEEYAQQRILGKIRGKKAVLLVPGDPMMATTHIDLRLRAEKAGIKTRVIPGASIFSAVCAATGLQAYRFGRTVTVPHTESGRPPESPYDHIKTNLGNGLHTLTLLDIVAERNYYMPIREGLEYLLQIELNRKESVIHDNRIVVGVARAGASDETVRTGVINELLRYDFGGPPHCLVAQSTKSAAVSLDSYNSILGGISSVIAFLGVSLSGIGIYWGDAVAGMLIASLLFVVAYSAFKEGSLALMDACMCPDVLETVESVARGVREVEGIHDIRLRRAGPYIIGEVHVKVDGNMTVQRADEIAAEVEKRLYKSIEDLHMITVKVESKKSHGDSSDPPIREEEA